MRKVYLVLCVLVIGIGWSSFRKNKSEDSFDNNAKETEILTIDESSSEEVPTHNNELKDDIENGQRMNEFKITKETAFQIAYDEAKKYANEYELIIPDNIDSVEFRYEEKYQNNVQYYAVVIDNLLMKDKICTSAMGIDIDSQSGEILAVHRFK